MQRISFSQHADWQALLEKLRHTNYTNKQLNLSRHHLTDYHIAKLAEILKVNQTIKSINLSWNFIGPDGAKSLAQEGIKLVALDLHMNQLGDAGADALIKANNIYHLDLSFNQIGTDGLRSIANNTRLEFLNLRSNQIGTEGAMQLAKHRYIKYLDVVGNHITDEGASALAANKTISTLIISYNPLVAQSHLGEVSDTVKSAIHLSEARYFIHADTTRDWNDRPLLAQTPPVTHLIAPATMPATVPVPVPASAPSSAPPTPFQSTLQFWKKREQDEKIAKKENRLKYIYRY